jgi:hypothetical protein
MANYYAAARTNAFQVKDEEAFLLEIAPIKGLTLIKENIQEDGIQRYVLTTDYEQGNGWSSLYLEYDEDNISELDIMDIIPEHLPDNEVCIFMEVGNEKLRYLVGTSIAVNNKNQAIKIFLNDIYEQLDELTDTPELITRAEY